VSRRTAWWILFVSFWVFLPAIYFVYVAAGWLPAVLYVFYSFGSNGIIWLAHVAAYLILYFLAASLGVRLLLRITEERRRKVVLAAIVGLMAISSLFPIYSIGLHARGYPVNIVGAFRDAGKISPVPW
jgi:hypothetical protein